MKKIFLHIGEPKTGSTAIENFLQKLYDTKVLQQYDFAFLCQKIYQLITGAWSNPAEQENLDRFITFVSTFLKNTKENNIIISQDVFSSKNILKYNNLPCIAQLFKDYEVHVFVYIRRYDQYYESLWAQSHKRLNTSIFFQIPEELHKKDILDEYAKYFKKENIHVRVYDRQKLFQKNVIYDFLQWIHLEELFPFVEKKENTNPSLSPTNLRIRLSYARQNMFTEKAKVKKLEELKKKWLPIKKVYRWTFILSFGEQDVELM